MFPSNIIVMYKRYETLNCKLNSWHKRYNFVKRNTSCYLNIWHFTYTNNNKTLFEGYNKFYLRVGNSLAWQITISPKIITFFISVTVCKSFWSILQYLNLFHWSSIIVNNMNEVCDVTHYKGSFQNTDKYD